MDLRTFPDLPAGPYFLTFDLVTAAEGSGQFFYTVDQKTTLPNGKRLTFPVHTSPKKQRITLNIGTKKTLKQLRLDVSEGPGKATIQNLTLLRADKKVLVDWTPAKK